MERTPAHPGDTFRYDEELDGYIYNLPTGGLSSGSHILSFTVPGDPTTHSVTFTLR